MQGFASSYYGQKPIYMTEYSHMPDFNDAIRSAWHIHNAMVYEKVNAYIYWSLWGAPRGDDINDGAILLPNNTDYVIRPTYYAVKHYSWFTGANWYRINATPSPSANLRITAFKNPAGNKLTIVIVNIENRGVKLALALNGFSPIRSEVYMTNITQRWLYLGAYNPSKPLLCPRRSIITVSMSSTLYDDCGQTLAAGQRLPADIAGSGDCYVNYLDFAVLASHWLETGCTEPDNCQGADFEPEDGAVNYLDLGNFADQWMQCNDPESPNCLWRSEEHTSELQSRLPTD
jgi:hypothetical protein